MYQHADVGASINLMGRIAIEQALNSRMVDACNMMQTKCIEVLKMYRSLVGVNAPRDKVRLLFRRHCRWPNRWFNR